MKQVEKFKPITSIVILHGAGESPEWIWYPWLKENFLDIGVTVNAPQMPNPLVPDCEQWIAAMEKAADNWDEGTLVVGHNFGGVLGLRLLEKIAPRKVHSIVLVSTPFCAEARIEAILKFFTCNVDWKKLRERASNRIIFHSKNDKIIPYDHSLRYKEFLDGALILTTQEGHYNKSDFPEFIEAIKGWLPQ
jgi:predicted alpha/beta hydrolase family esterase